MESELLISMTISLISNLLKFFQMKKLLFMLFILGGVAMGFTACGGEDEGGDEETTESAEGGEEEEEGGGH